MSKGNSFLLILIDDNKKEIESIIKEKNVAITIYFLFILLIKVLMQSPFLFLLLHHIYQFLSRPKKRVFTFRKNSKAQLEGLEPSPHLLQWAIAFPMQPLHQFEYNCIYILYHKTTVATGFEPVRHFHAV